MTPYHAILDGIEAHLGPRLLDQAIETAICAHRKSPANRASGTEQCGGYDADAVGATVGMAAGRDHDGVQEIGA